MKQDDRLLIKALVLERGLTIDDSNKAEEICKVSQEMCSALLAKLQNGASKQELKAMIRSYYVAVQYIRQEELEEEIEERGNVFVKSRLDLLKDFVERTKQWHEMLGIKPEKRENPFRVLYELIL